jgi:hypothetical protein
MKFGKTRFRKCFCTWIALICIFRVPFNFRGVPDVGQLFFFGTYILIPIPVILDYPHFGSNIPPNVGG